MKVTREMHFNYMVKLVPVLALLYFIQSWIYLNYMSHQGTKEIVGMLGLSLAALIVGFFFYDHFHQVELHSKHLEVHFGPLHIHREVLYRDVASVTIEGKGKYATVVLELEDGEEVVLHHVDDAEKIKKIILGR